MSEPKIFVLYPIFTPTAPLAMFPVSCFLFHVLKRQRELFPLYNHPPPVPLPSSMTFPLTSRALTPPLGRIPPALTSTPLRLTTLPAPPIPPPVRPIPPQALAFPNPTVPVPHVPCPPRFPVPGTKARCSMACLRFCCWIGGVGGFISNGRGIMFSSWLVYSNGDVCDRGW